MSSSQRGNRLGPYKLEQRYRNTGDLGRVYRARNTLTGAPALVVKPTERTSEDAPLADWQLRLLSSTSPAYLSLEVESAPEAADAQAAGEELEYMLDDLMRALICTGSRPETLPHLRSPRARERAEWNPVHRLFGAALAAAFAGAIIFAGNSGPPPAAPVATSELAVARHDAGWDGSGDLTGLLLTDTADTQPLVISRPMPKEPFDVQKRPPCKKVLEEEHFDGCWVPLEVRAPCPDEAYELGSKCYWPAAKPRPKPSSIFE
jgi:hypothetical protein